MSGLESLLGDWQVQLVLLIVVAGIAVKAILAWCNHGKKGFDIRLTVRSAIIGLITSVPLVYTDIVNTDTSNPGAALVAIFLGIAAVVGVDKLAKDVGVVVKKPAPPTLPAGE